MAAVMTQNTSFQQQLADYLGKKLPPYMTLHLNNHPADLSVHMAVDLKMGIHFKGRPNSEFVKIVMRKVAQVQNAQATNPKVFRDALTEIQRQYAKEIASGVIDGRQFNRFVFEGGTIQELGRVGQPPKYNPPGLSMKPGAIWTTGAQPNTLNQLSKTPAALQFQSNPSAQNNLYGLMQQALAAANATPDNVIDLTSDKDNLTLNDLRDAIVQSRQRNMNTNMIWITPAQRYSLLADPAFPKYAANVATVYGHDLEVRS